MDAQADPNTSSRAVFTEVKSLKELYQLLANHPGMGRNNEQVFAQPAHEKNTVYFMWDFVGRTIVCSRLYLSCQALGPFVSSTMAYMIDPALPSKPDVKERWSDIMSRSVMAANLLLDQPPGMLDQMVNMSYPNQSGEKPVIGNDIKDAARKLT
ncbi:hypothetical protein D0864_16753 [Hortaea werneckii]|uniref:Uncharacterized protein n=1 Tax=Hortaea werneckii TaxID=91943 RepID=A0A3M7B265_HORWE|nr:hypothetical protein D0864_16753 [Hortaea werneckii]